MCEVSEEVLPLCEVSEEDLPYVRSVTKVSHM